MAETSKRRFAARPIVVLAFAAVTAGLSNTRVWAADARGCSDPAGLKRFSRSSIVLCEAREFAEYVLPTGQATRYDLDIRRAVFQSSLALEGRLVQNVYAAPTGPSSAEVFRNYKAELDGQGFTLLFEAKGAETGSALPSYFENMGPGTQIWGYSPDEARYLAAVREDGGGKTYVALYVIEYQDGYEPRFSPEKGQVMTRLDVLQTGQLQSRMTAISAAEIGRSLITNGRAAIYGITFDFNQANIRPESRPTLDEIGKFLRENPAQKVYVVGHTDNVGGFDFNMQLSRSRAGSVVSELARTYGIRPDRMTASGVGLQAPVASNTTEDGRAKNRRVELLPR